MLRPGSFVALAVSALSLAVWAPHASAATDTTSFNVLITITNACDIHTTAPTNVDFGSQPSTATNVDNQGALNVNCTPNAAYSIGLDNGLNGADVSTRKMASGANQVPYQLYRNAARGAADVWGSTTGTGGNVYTGTGTGSVQAIPVYGRVPNTNFPAGNYSDTIVATITY